MSKLSQPSTNTASPTTALSTITCDILFPEEADIDEKEWLYAAASNPAFDFLKEPEEDIYTTADGRPFHDNR